MKDQIQRPSFQFRCDGIPHCKDSSDESSCQVVNIDSTYSKFLSPPAQSECSNETSRLGVFSSITVHSMEAFDPVGGDYLVKFTVKMRGKWCETHLRAKQMQNSAREKYKITENEKSL